MNEALDGTNADTNKVVTTDSNDKEGDGVEHDEVEEGNEKKRQKTSSVWLEFKEVSLSDGSKKVECVHCKRKLVITTSKSTTHFKRHLSTCVQWKIYHNQQQRINFQPVNTGGDVQILHAFTDGKFDMEKMRKAAAHWILMHEHPFSIMEEEGFNMMQKCGMPEWEKTSHDTIKKYCMQVYETEKKKLKVLLKTVSKISLTTDLWKSSNQKIEYMVLTAHFIDCNWRLQKRVINFVHIPPPRRGVEIADCIFKCLKE
ncbi:hypothetical protein CRYUN_Cryun07bG0161800 [Craigia yunnanensis]